MKQKLIFVIVMITLLLAACSSEHPQIDLEAYNLDFGDVINGEIVEWELAVSNIGNAPLVVEAVSTSCGCTSATLEPMTISPGESGILHIEFDSGAHGPELTGEFSRQIFIASNDPQNPEVRVEFVSNVIANSSP